MHIIEGLYNDGRFTQKPCIVFGGLSGSGKGLYSESMQRLLRCFGYNLKITTAGQIMRETAKEENQDLGTFLRRLESDRDYSTNIDYKIDEKTLEVALKEGGVIEGRRAPLVVGGWGYRVVIETDPISRARRISNNDRRQEVIDFNRLNGRRPTPDEVLSMIQERDWKDRERYNREYGIGDFMSTVRQKTNLIIDNSEDIIPNSGEGFEDAFLRGKAWRSVALGTTLWLQKNGFL